MENKCNCLCHILPSTKKSNFNDPLIKCKCCFYCPVCNEKLIENGTVLEYSHYDCKGNQRVTNNDYHDYVMIYNGLSMKYNNK